jgi:hypothetical protein
MSAQPKVDPWWLWFALIGGAAAVGFMKLMEAIP